MSADRFIIFTTRVNRPLDLLPPRGKCLLGPLAFGFLQELSRLASADLKLSRRMRHGENEMRHHRRRYKCRCQNATARAINDSRVELFAINRKHSMIALIDFALSILRE